MISLCPLFSCAAYCSSNVRAKKPLPLLCPELLLCSQLVGLNPYMRPLEEKHCFWLPLFRGLWFSRPEKLSWCDRETGGRMKKKGRVGTNYLMNFPWNSKGRVGGGRTLIYGRMLLLQPFFKQSCYRKTNKAQAKSSPGLSLLVWRFMCNLYPAW